MTTLLQCPPVIGRVHRCADHEAPTHRSRRNGGIQPLNPVLLLALDLRVRDFSGIADPPAHYGSSTDEVQAGDEEGGPRPQFARRHQAGRGRHPRLAEEPPTRTAQRHTGRAEAPVNHRNRLTDCLWPRPGYLGYIAVACSPRAIRRECWRPAAVESLAFRCGQNLTTRRRRADPPGPLTAIN